MKTGRTNDKSTVYVTQQLGPKQSTTPEGFLLCEDVPIARTGVQQYSITEVPADGDLSGIVNVDRIETEVFRAETLASFEGKPVTIGHPDAFVDPSNFKDLACGVTMNVRRGEGANDQWMYADLLITTADAIATIKQYGIKEVSCGYEADYEQGEPGRAVQRNIVGNHVALVARGRCGPSCAIGDQTMSTKKLSFADRIRRALKSKDEEEGEKIAKEMEDAEEAEKEEKEKDKMADAVRSVLDAALKPIRDDLEALKKKAEKEDDDDDGDTKDTIINPETGEKLDMTGVKLYTGDALKSIQQRAEILAPGMHVPTFDAKTTDAKRAVALCACQRKALDAAYATDDGKAAIEPFLGGRTIATLPHADLRAAFVGASEVLKTRNNNGNHAGFVTRDFGKTVTADAMNQANKDFWDKRRAAR